MPTTSVDSLGCVQRSKFDGLQLVENKLPRLSHLFKIRRTENVLWIWADLNDGRQTKSGSMSPPHAELKCLLRQGSKSESQSKYDYFSMYEPSDSQLD